MELSEDQLLQVFEGVPSVNFSAEQLQSGIDIVSFLANSGIFPSKGDARKTLLGWWGTHQY